MTVDVLGSTSAEIVDAARALVGTGTGIARALYADVMRRGCFEPRTHGVGPRAAAAWRRHFSARLPAVLPRSDAGEPTEHGTPTQKAILRARDGLELETVHVPLGRTRSAVCVSTQIGCRMACRFCETGRMGLWRDLTPGEIVGQVVVGRAALGWRPRTVVFQGMGEPLDNFAALAQSLRVLNDRCGLSLAYERMTVCTAGHVEGIRALARLGLKRLNLSLSLNAADDDLRKELMPIHRRTDLATLQRALIEYRQRANLMIGIHYCLMPGINDTGADARAVARFCAPLGRILVHLIPYNPGTRPLTRTPRRAEVERFVAWLRDAGLPVRMRIPKGRSLMAACGQLGDPTLRRRRAVCQASGDSV